MFMLATSEGDVYSASDFPQCMFSRKYRNATFVVYNIRYDEGALLQHLPRELLQTLRIEGEVSYNEWRYFTIPHKMLRISKGKNSITIYDLASFFGVSLDTAARAYLQRGKIDIVTKDFTQEYVTDHRAEIAAYCIQDAVLVRDLANALIKRFESFGVFPRKLYSTAYISYQYFAAKTDYVDVGEYWEKHRDVLDMAMQAYAGGKFEVTEKGVDYYYEYDISSAYPYEISQLYDVRGATIKRSRRYVSSATYGFLRVRMDIPPHVYSPCPIKRGSINTFPVGVVERVITKAEYDYLVALGVDIEIISAVWLILNHKTQPYRQEVERLYAEKSRAKEEKRTLDYHIIKIFLNSLYGKFVQLVRQGNMWRASACWNPIYGAIITANARIRVSEMQQKYPSVVAVHTDSVLSTKPIPCSTTTELGAWLYETEGKGLILGSGIYQIGSKTRFRGFASRMDLFKLLETHASFHVMKPRRPISWREVIFHSWNIDRINRFEDVYRQVRVDFDTKRLWLDEWDTFAEVATHKVISLPLRVSPIFGYVIEPKRCDRCGHYTQRWTVDYEPIRKRGGQEGWIGGSYLEHKGRARMKGARKLILCERCYLGGVAESSCSES